MDIEQLITDSSAIYYDFLSSVADNILNNEYLKVNTDTLSPEVAAGAQTITIDTTVLIGVEQIIFFFPALLISGITYLAGVLYSLAGVATYPFVLSISLIGGIVFFILFGLFSFIFGILAFVLGLVVMITSPVWGLILVLAIMFFQVIMWGAILWMSINVGIIYGIASLVALFSPQQ